MNWIYDDDKKYPPDINYIIEEASKASDEYVAFEMNGVPKRIRFEDSVEEAAGQTAVTVRRECKGDVFTVNMLLITILLLYYIQLKLHLCTQFIFLRLNLPYILYQTYKLLTMKSSVWAYTCPPSC